MSSAMMVVKSDWSDRQIFWRAIRVEAPGWMAVLGAVLAALAMFGFWFSSSNDRMRGIGLCGVLLLGGIIALVGSGYISEGAELLLGSVKAVACLLICFALISLLSSDDHRIGFLLAGLLLLSATVFILIFVGDEWNPVYGTRDEGRFGRLRREALRTLESQSVSSETHYSDVFPASCPTCHSRDMEETTTWTEYDSDDIAPGDLLNPIENKLVQVTSTLICPSCGAGHRNSEKRVVRRATPNFSVSRRPFVAPSPYLTEEETRRFPTITSGTLRKTTVHGYYGHYAWMAPGWNGR